jgi:hypothetical protein
MASRQVVGRPLMVTPCRFFLLPLFGVNVSIPDRVLLHTVVNHELIDLCQICRTPRPPPAQTAICVIESAAHEQVTSEIGQGPERLRLNIVGPAYPGTGRAGYTQRSSQCAMWGTHQKRTSMIADAPQWRPVCARPSCPPKDSMHTGKPW